MLKKLFFHEIIHYAYYMKKIGILWGKIEIFRTKIRFYEKIMK